MEQSPIIKLRSGENKFWVQAGGGAFGYGGVALYQNETGMRRSSNTVGLLEGQNPGFVLAYDNVATIIVDDTVEWTNNLLLPYSKDQLLRKRGRIDVRVFRSEQIERFLEEYRRQILDIGINIG